MKSLKYEGVVKLKIFWSLRRLEAGLSGFKIKRVHYGKFGLQIIRESPNFSKPNAPLPFYIKTARLPPPFRLLLLRSSSSWRPTAAPASLPLFITSLRPFSPHTRRPLLSPCLSSPLLALPPPSSLFFFFSGGGQGRSAAMRGKVCYFFGSPS